METVTGKRPGEAGSSALKRPGEVTARFDRRQHSFVDGLVRHSEPLPGRAVRRPEAPVAVVGSVVLLYRCGSAAFCQLFFPMTLLSTSI